MSKPARPKFYVVWVGRVPGVYATWDEASRQVTGYAGAKFKSFATRGEAIAAFGGSHRDYVGAGSKPVRKSLDDLWRLGIDPDSIAVDAACAGAPGPMEYQGVSIATGELLFHAGPYDDGTNNVGEFLAIVDALSYLLEHGKPRIPIYSDSVNAQLWVRARTCRTKLLETPLNAAIFEMIQRAEQWLRTHPVTNPILKWETAEWGEIPADFGRK